VSVLETTKRETDSEICFDTHAHKSFLFSFNKIMNELSVSGWFFMMINANTNFWRLFIEEASCWFCAYLLPGLLML
jgi:hypothetical protein